MPLLNTLQFILRHPLNRGRPISSLYRYASWQVRSRLRSEPIPVKYVNDTKLLVSRGQAGATGNVYAGLHELAEMAFVLHMLRPGDLFVDVGANVGSYTILAAATGATVVSFEPGDAAYRRLCANVTMNEFGSRVLARNEAVGATPGDATFTQNADTLNRVALPTESGDVSQVLMTTLDAALDGRSPVLIKIDVEGFESSVIAGASRTLWNASLRAVIMETNGSGERYASTDEALYRTMLNAGFTACTYDPFARKLESTTMPSPNGNTIFVRNLAEARDRVTSAPSFNIAGRHII